MNTHDQTLAIPATFRLLLCSAVLLFAACGDELQPVEPDLPVSVDAGRMDTCETGDLGCDCASGDVCGTDSRGERLICQENLCVSPNCEAGTTGCVCRASSGCLDEADACSDGVCMPRGCQAGELNCECLSGTCNANLHCNTSLGGGTCVDGTGHPGGPCPKEGSCFGHSRCDTSTDTCIHCDAGSQGCVATEAGGCNEGLKRSAGRCHAPLDVKPDDPVCYTRCRDDLGGAGDLSCDAQGFVEGCVGEFTCEDGSCVQPGQPVPSCETEGQCPDHQDCIEGRCYSTCSTRDQCPTGYVCSRHACRIPCDRRTNEALRCGDGFYCHLRNSDSGVCMPKLEPTDDDGVPATRVTGDFQVSHDAIIFTDIPADANQRRSVFVDIELDAEEQTLFTVERTEERLYDSLGELLLERASSEGELPLAFVELGLDDGQPVAGALEVSVPADCGSECPRIRLSLPAELGLRSDATRWEGTIEIRSRLGLRTVKLSHATTIEGRWTGSMHYFATFGEVGLSQWARGDTKDDAGGVSNALIRSWAAYRRGNLDGFEEMRAVLDATTTELWRRSDVKAACGTEPGDCGTACYPYDDGTGAGGGIQEYTAEQCGTARIPTGAVEHPIALNLRKDRDDNGAGYRIAGKIDSEVALHYPGDPAFAIRFAGDPADPAHCEADGVPDDCALFVSTAVEDTLLADVAVGARTEPADDGSCPTGLAPAAHPWLLTDFTGRTVLDAQTGQPVVPQCRETRLPMAADIELNKNLAGGNPVPDGRVLRRKLRVLDGAMVNQSHLFVLFEETFEAHVDDEGSRAYGYMLLERSAERVRASDYAGNEPTVTRTAASHIAGPTCSPELLDAIAGSGFTLRADNASLLATALIRGIDPDTVDAGPHGGATPLDPSRVHYLCEETGTLDGGESDDGSPVAVQLPCPADSRVRFFAFIEREVSQSQIASMPCQGRGNCGEALDGWERSGVIQMDPIWLCEDPKAVYCSDNRGDLRDEKVFFPRPDAADGAVVRLGGLAPMTQDAFRYKTGFQGSRRKEVGFAPMLCDPGDPYNQYCYDAEVIEQLAERFDCLLAIYRDYATTPAEAKWTELRAFLSASLGITDIANTRAPLQHGFERLYAELLIMLGDQAVTDALTSRFESSDGSGAGSNEAAFLGSSFEVDGPDLHGIAGFEMRSLHAAVQYYQMATERFYHTLSPVIRLALERGDRGDNAKAMITPALVSSYLDRVVGGSAKRSDAWAAIAKRYKDVNRPDVAQRVIERAYTATYTESALLIQLMVHMADASDARDRDQLLQRIETHQRRYAIALRQMRELYASFGDSINVFGFTDDYVPFPALDEDSRSVNGFDAVLSLARRRADTARGYEVEAIESDRRFDTDKAAFSSELTRVAIAHETRLHEICGSFTGTDGRTYPSIDKYASLLPGSELRTAMCGVVGKGQLHLRALDVLLLVDEQHELEMRLDHLQEQFEDEQNRVALRCGLVDEIADFQLEVGNTVNSLQAGIRDLRNVVSSIDRGLNVGLAVASAGGMMEKVQVKVLLAGLLAASMGPVAAGIIENKIARKENEIDELNVHAAHWMASKECTAMQIESDVVGRQILRAKDELELEALKLQHRFVLARAEIERLHTEAKRVAQEKQVSEQLVIDVEAARNDPNIRLFRNAAVVNADRTFARALRHAYRATRMYEYFTSQTYARKDALFVTRMVSRGQFNLDNYLDELEDDYEFFRSRFQSKANRVERISLVEDVLLAPYQDEHGELTMQERVDFMRDALSDPQLLDEDGRLSIPFRTSLQELSPCTFNQQIRYIEMQLLGGDSVDLEADLMLWQEGTGIIEAVDGSRDYYSLPPALTVATPWMDTINRASSVFDPSTYRRYEMRGRPFINTAWRLVFDQRNNRENQDIDLEQLTDIVLYVYYTDFTDPSMCR